MNNASYKVDFEPDFTLSYSDREGVIKFGFDAGDKPKSFFIEKIPFTKDFKRMTVTAENSARIDYALQKIVEYLQSSPRNYEVEIG